MTTIEELEEQLAEQQHLIDELINLMEAMTGKSTPTSSGWWTAYRPTTDTADEDSPTDTDDAEAWATQLNKLTEWLEWAWPTLLRGHANAKALPACWPNHPGAVEELLALYSAWLASYTADEANEARIAWHDRWAPASAQRVIGPPYLLGNCTATHCTAQRQIQRPETGGVPAI